MALTLAQRTQQRKRAAAASSKNGPEMTMEGANAYELQLAQLHHDGLRLKQLQSGEAKGELKRVLLPNYRPYVEGVLQAGRGAQDQVISTMMVWAIDAGDYPYALKIGAYVLKHGLLLADKFERKAGTLFAEEIAEAALNQQKSGGSFDLQTLIDTERLISETKQDMPDQVRAKLHLAIGKALIAFPDEQVQDHLPALEKAQTELARAIELHGACGAKKDLDRVKRLLKRHAAPPAS